MAWKATSIKSTYTTGELKALVAPVCGIGAEDVAAVALVIFTADGGMKLAGTMPADLIGEALLTGVVAEALADTD
jgi:hypothetical protein